MKLIDFDNEGVLTIAFSEEIENMLQLFYNRGKELRQLNELENQQFAKSLFTY